MATWRLIVPPQERETIIAAVSQEYQKIFHTDVVVNERW
jgi:hypothetical protein